MCVSISTVEEVMVVNVSEILFSVNALKLRTWNSTYHQNMVLLMGYNRKSQPVEAASTGGYHTPSNRDKLEIEVWRAQLLADDGYSYVRLEVYSAS